MRYENTSLTPQKVWDTEGKSYEMAPGAVDWLKPDVAKLFLEQCPGEILEFKDATVPLDPGASEMWVANNTGNPHFPRTHEIRVYDRLNKKWENAIEDHPLREPHTIKHKWDPGQADLMVDGRLIKNANLPSVTIKLPPYHRRKLPKPVVHAWRACLNFGPEEQSLALIESRQPGIYEPNETWELDHIVAFGECCQKRFKVENELKFKSECKGEVEEEKEKNKARELVYYMCIDPSIKLPPEKAVTRMLSEMRSNMLSRGKKI